MHHFVVERPDNFCIFCLSSFPKPLSSSEFLSEPPSSSLADPLEDLSVIHNGHCVEKPFCSSPQESSSLRGWCLQTSSCSCQTQWRFFWISPSPHVVHQQFLLVLLLNIFVIQLTAFTLAQVMIIISPLEN